MLDPSQRWSNLTRMTAVAPPWWEHDACMSLQRWHHSNELFGENVWLLMLVIVFAVLYSIDTLIAASAILTASFEFTRSTRMTGVTASWENTKLPHMPTLTNCRHHTVYSDLHKAHPSERIGLLRQ